MGKKASNDHTAQQRSAASPPLDDEARWIPLIAVALPQLVKRTGNARLAVLDLEHALAEGKLPCMIRSVSTGERKLFSPSAWTELVRLHPFGFGEHVPWGVAYRGPPDDSYVLKVKEYVGWMFYVWKPDFETVWTPPGSARTDDEPLHAIDRAKAVLLDLYSTKQQMAGSLKQATRDVVKECGKRGWTPPSEDTVQRAAEELGYRPPRKRR